MSRGARGGISARALQSPARILLSALAVLRASTCGFALFVGILAAAALAPAPSKTQAPALESFAGRYVHTGARSELRAMEGAIDRVVNQMNIFIREIARGEVHRRITPERRITIDVLDGSTLTLAMDDWGPLRIALGGVPRQTRDPGGEPTSLSARFDAGRLVQRTQSPRGSRTNVFALSPDGEQLSMQVRIASDQLPAEIRYRLTYRRVD